MYRFFSYVDYAKKRLEEIVVEKEFLNDLSEDSKRNLIEKLENSLYYKDGYEDKYSLFHKVRSSILPYIKECYCKQYRMHIDCTIRDEFIEKQFTRMFQIISPDNEKTFMLPFSTTCEPISTIEEDKLMEVICCNYSENNNETQIDYLDQVKNGIEKTTLDDGRIVFSYSHKFGLMKGINNIKIITKTIVPASDTTYVHRILVPCERYSVNFSLCSDGYQVNGVGFSLDVKSNVQVEKYEKCCKLVFQNWVLPGEGCAFTIKKAT